MDNEVRWMNSYNEILNQFLSFVKNNCDHCESTVNRVVNNQVIMLFENVS